MDEPAFYKIRGWEDYQHYKYRNPPWIRLHKKIMESHDWIVWDDASRLLAIALLMLASEEHVPIFRNTEHSFGNSICRSGYIPNDKIYIQKRCRLDTSPDLKPLLDSGFLIDASTMLANAEETLASAPETMHQIQSKSSKRESNNISTFGKRGMKEKTVIDRGVKKFDPPSREMVLAYMLEKGVKDDVALRESKVLVEFYESKGWMVGKNKMASWRSAVAGWITRNNLATDMKKQWEEEDALRRAKELMDVPF